MTTQSSSFIFLSTLLVFAYSVTGDNSTCDCSNMNLDRSSFKPGFVFGAGGAAYQVEGAWNVGGKGLSNWDYFTHSYPTKIDNGSTGDVAIDAYHRYKEDVALARDMGLDVYRFSIAWSRILPYGKLNGGQVNYEGINYYNNLINEILANGITPYVTLFHWDLPQVLVDEYGGFLSEKIVEDFEYYAGVCFKHFGDRVKNWITLNEPWTYSVYGYDTGVMSPGRCSSWYNVNCTGGNSGREPYIVTHNLILSHATAVQLYRNKYKPRQKGRIGITLVAQWYEPCNVSNGDEAAVYRKLEFMLGWYLNPITYGSYPKRMRSLVKNRLPVFNVFQKLKVAGSYDFLGVNYYTTYYASNTTSDPSKLSYTTDSQVDLEPECNGTQIGPKAGDSDWLYIYPAGIKKLLNYIKKNYKSPLMVITENGSCESNNASLPLIEALNDTVRRDYISDHLCCLHEAISEDDVNVTGYIAWALTDNLEWQNGYSVRFGLNYIDYEHNLQRIPKLSALWFKNFISRKTNQSSIPFTGEDVASSPHLAIM